MGMPPARNTEVLLGPEHTILGDVAVRSMGPGVAIALSRGKHGKGYPALDPNEDAVLASVSGPSLFLAVVDGHNGFDAARAAVGAVTTALPDLHEGDPADGLGREVTERIRLAVRHASPARQQTGCALLLARLHALRLQMRAWGDAGLVVVRGRRVHRLDRTSPFLTADSPHGGVTASVRLRAGDQVIAATDGLFDFLGHDWRGALRRAAAGDAATVTRNLVETVFAAALSDNLAMAVATVTATPEH